MCFGQCDERDSGAARSHVIDRNIHRDGTRKKKEVKLLLLGKPFVGRHRIGRHRRAAMLPLAMVLCIIMLHLEGWK
jgi:hypothetical protein